MASGVKRGGTDPLVTTDGSGGHRPEVIAYAPGGTGANPQQGAATIASTQVTLVATTSTNILAARATRRFARVRVDSAAAVGAYVTEITPASAINGLFIPPGASEDIPYTGILYAYSTGTPLLYIRDVYDS